MIRLQVYGASAVHEGFVDLTEPDQDHAEPSMRFNVVGPQGYSASIAIGCVGQFVLALEYVAQIEMRWIIIWLQSERLPTMAKRLIMLTLFVEERRQMVMRLSVGGLQSNGAPA